MSELVVIFKRLMHRERKSALRARASYATMVVGTSQPTGDWWTLSSSDFAGKQRVAIRFCANRVTPKAGAHR